MGKFLNKLFFPQERKNYFNINKYIRDFKEGAFKDLFVLGISETNQGSWLKKNFTKEPNALYVGSMGSGKSVAASFTTLTWMLGNNDKTMLFVIDTLKGANDYQALFPLPNVYEVLSSEEKVHRVIDLVYDEMMRRKELFNELKAESIDVYEKKAKRAKWKKQKIARIIMLFEEFHTIPPAINYDKDYKKLNTTAKKFHEIMKVGRSLGIWVIACTQKGTSSDVPTEIVNNFTQKQIFKVNQVEATFLLNNVAPAKLKSSQKGRCYTDYGAVQFPYIPINTQKYLIEEYVKNNPFNADCAYITGREMVESYLLGESTEEIYKFKKLSDLVDGIVSYDAPTVVSILHKKMGHKVEYKNMAVDDFGVSHIVSYRDEDDEEETRIAVSIRVRKKITPKHISMLERGMDEYECPYGIIYTSAEDLNKSLYDAAISKNIEIVDHEDMLRFARKVELGGDQLEFNPSELADDSKEDGIEQGNKDLDSAKKALEERRKEREEYEKIKAQEEAETERLLLEMEREESESVEDEEDISTIIDSLDTEEEDISLDELKPLDPSLLGEDVEDISEEVEDSQPIDMPNPIKEFDPLGDKLQLDPELEEQIKSMIDLKPRLGNNTPQEVKPKVKHIFKINSDETPNLLVHLLKNKEGDVYRALFLVFSDNRVVHKYYLDRKVQGNFSSKDKIKFGLKQSSDWNKMEGVLDPNTFDEMLLEYFNNFEDCDLDINTVCWKEDFSFIKEYTKESNHMADLPTLLDEWVLDCFGDYLKRSEAFEKGKIKIEKDFFGEIAADYEFWKSLN